MKTISKKIKSIYLLAIMAVLSICVAVFPVFKTDAVKADEASGLSITGANIEFSKKGVSDFALMFQAEITKTLYDSVADKNATFGMAIGPKAQLSSVTTFEQLDDISDGSTGNAWVFTSLVGTASSDANQLVEFEADATTFTFEAGTYYAKVDYAGVDIDWTGVYATDLVAIPFYTVEGAVQFDASLAFTSSPKTEATETLLEESALPWDSAERTLSDDAFRNITGMSLTRATSDYKEAAGAYTQDDIYFNMQQKTFYANLHHGGTDYKNMNMLRIWVPFHIGRGGTLSAGYALGYHASNSAYDVPAWFAGEEILKKSTNTTLAANAFTATRLGADDPLVTAVDNLIPGESYRIYYKNTQIANRMSYIEYTVASDVFTSFTAPTSAQGSTQSSRLLAAISMTDGASATNQGSFFALRTDVLNFVMPAGQVAKGYTNETGYNGYYVLGGDLIVPSAVDGSQVVVGQSTTKAGLHAAPTNQTSVRAQIIGAMKEAPAYINNIDGAYAVGGGFTGTFDGRGHTIDASFARGGLLGVIKGGTVKDLNIRADFYQYDLSGTQVFHTEKSYSEKSATLAEVIYDGSTIENVSIELKENAYRTFQQYFQNMADASDNTSKLEMDNVPGILASQGIIGAKTTLKNVIIKCDALKDAGVSVQNFRAALNIAANCKVDNLFVIGSSYTNMSIETTTADDVNTYTLTVSVAEAPEGFDFGAYALAENPALEAYGNMAIDMYKWMRNADIADGNIMIKFVKEPATKKFINEDAFQAYLNSEEGAEDKAELIATHMWKVKDGSLVWAKEVIEGTTYLVTAGTKSYKVPVKTADTTFVDRYNWTTTFPGLTEYTARVVLSDGTVATLPQA